MAFRLYRPFNVKEMEAVVSRNWNTVYTLRLIEKELRQRKVGKDNLLLLKVKQRIGELRLINKSRGAERKEQTELQELLAEVGLHPCAPDFLLDAAEKAYRAELHPDKYSSVEGKAAAVKLLETMEEIFDKIKKLRQSMQQSQTPPDKHPL